MGSIRGNGDGEALVGVYDLEANIVGQTAVHPSFDFDDHNSPVFFQRFRRIIAHGLCTA